MLTELEPEDEAGYDDNAAPDSEETADEAGGQTERDGVRSRYRHGASVDV
jgi:hypothetical protein